MPRLNSGSWPTKSMPFPGEELSASGAGPGLSPLDSADPGLSAPDSAVGDELSMGPGGGGDSSLLQCKAPRMRKKTNGTVKRRRTMEAPSFLTRIEIAIATSSNDLRVGVSIPTLWQATKIHRVDGPSFRIHGA